MQEDMATLSGLLQNYLQGQMKIWYERSLQGKRDYIARITLSDILAHVSPKTHGKSPIAPSIDNAL